MVRTRPAVAMLACALLACEGAGPADAGVDTGPGDSGPLRIDDAGAPDVVAGQVRYEDQPFDERGFLDSVPERPSAGVLVELFDAAGALLGSARTDAEGRFRISVAGAAPAAPLTVRASADVLYEGHQVRVISRDRPARVYALEASVRPGDAVTLVARALDARRLDGLGGPFNIVDVARDAFVLYAPHVGAPAPALTYRWAAGQAYECGSCYGDDVISLGGQVEDTDEYDDDIILHELAHYWVEHYGRDTSPAGTHRNMQVEPELAYGEGLAYFFACMVRGTPVVVDTFLGSTRVIDVEEYLQNGESQPDFVGTTADGALREEIVAGILWDAFDEARSEEPFDRVALGVAAQLALLIYLRDGGAPDVGASGMDLADYLRALECEGGVPAADVQALADDRGYPYTAGGDC